MNLRKHLAGLAIFSAILSTAIFINYYLTLPAASLPPVPLEPPSAEAVESYQPISLTVRLVSLDFINGKSYATLVFKRKPGQAAPERLWVTTVFMSSEANPERRWMTQAEIRDPFAPGNQGNLPGTYEVTAVASCRWCNLPDTPAAGYFANIYIAVGDHVSSELPEEYDDSAAVNDAKILPHIPVLVQGRRGPRR
jgi:hypothetical protein